jgi:hypothetical protein
MPRSWHRFYAWVMNYFWLPCQVCGEMFGGHECHEALPGDDRLVCFRHGTPKVR